MYITINGQRYSCTRREADADEVRYYGVEPLPESVSGIVRTCTEAGFVLAEDHAEAYARQEIGTTRVTLTNKPEPTGTEYSEAVDVEDAPYTYAETDTPIPEPEGPETGDLAALEARLDAVESRLAALEEA